MKIYLFTGLVFLIFMAEPARAQDFFSKRYYIGATKFPHVIKTPSNGFVLCATENGSTKIVNHDACGNVIWSKSFSAIETGELNLCSNGDLLLCSGSYVTPRLVKINQAGAIIWSRTYSAGAYSYFVYSAGEFSNGDLFFSGIAEMQMNGPYKYFVVKTDASGNIKWSVCFGDPCCWGYGLACRDGGMLVRSGSISFKLDSLGNMQWSKVFNYTGYSLKPLEVSDGFVLARYSESSQRDTCFLYKIDKQGNLLWTSQSFYANDLTRIEKTPSGNFRTIGSMMMDPSNYKHVATLVELDSLGNFLGQAAFRTQPNVFSEGRDFCSLDDGSVIFTGRDDNGLFLAKTGGKWKTKCNDSIVTSYYPPRQVNATDFPVTVTALSFTASALYLSSADQPVSSDLLCAGYDSLTFSFPSNLCVSQAGNLVLSGPPGKQYLWGNGAVSQTIVVNVPGQYNLTVTDPCSGQSVVASATVLQCPVNGLSQSVLGEALEIYPNPANAFVTIRCRDLKQVSVYNSIGSCVARVKATANATQVDFSDLPPGIYLAEIYSGSRKVIKKIVVE